MLNNQGICILIEAPDGAGKDTLIENIQKKYKEKNFKVYKFPSGEFRKKIFEKPRTQLELVPIFCADFKQSINQIKKDLLDGKNIIINRMYISTILYSLENGVPPSFVYYNIDKAIGDWRPDLTVLMDIDPQEAFKRLTARTEERNWLDGNFDKTKRINNLYKEFFDKNWKKIYKNKDSIIQVNSNNSKENTINDFSTKFEKWLKKQTIQIK